MIFRGHFFKNKYLKIKFYLKNIAQPIETFYADFSLGKDFCSDSSLTWSSFLNFDSGFSTDSSTLNSLGIANVRMTSCFGGSHIGSRIYYLILN